MVINFGLYAACFLSLYVLSSNLPVGRRMAASFGVEFPDSIVDGLIEVFRSRGGLVSEVMPLQVAPNRFDVAQLRSGFRQPFDREPVSTLGEGGTRRLAGVDRAIVENEHDWRERDPELRAIAPINLFQESKEVRASFGPAGAHDELATRPVEHPAHRPFGALARRWDAQVGPFLGPDVREIGRGESFGLIAEQQHDVARLSLHFEQLSA